MTKQQLAQRRNYFKFILMGLTTKFDLDSLTVQRVCKNHLEEE